MLNKQFLYATTVLVGTIVGVGIFGLPYVASQSRFIVGLFFLLLLGVIVTLIHLLYAEVVLKTKEKHRLAVDKLVDKNLYIFDLLFVHKVNWLVLILLLIKVKVYKSTITNN